MGRVRRFLGMTGLRKSDAVAELNLPEEKRRFASRAASENETKAMTNISKALSAAGVVGILVLVGGCSFAPDKVLETSSVARKKPRAVEVTVDAPVARPSLSDKCLQRHVDYQAGRNQPASLEQKQAMDAACANVH